MAGNFNLKTVFSADTKDLKKGAAEAKQAVKDFDDTTTSALNEIAGLFGTSMGDISKTLSSVKGGFLKLSNGLGATTKSAGVMSNALKVLKVALASTGIGLIVVALGSLVAYFTKSQRGADMLSKVMGQLKQVVLTVTDYFIKLGEAIVKAFKNPGEAVKKFWKILTNKEEREALKNSIVAVGKDAEDRQKRRLALTERQIALEEKLTEFELKESELQRQIEEQKLIAADKAGKTATERAAANAQAQKLVNELADLRLEIAREQLAIMKEENSLSESMRENTREEKQLEAKINSILAERSRTNKELVAQAAEIQTAKVKELELEAKIARYRAQEPLEKINGSAVLGNVPVVQQNKKPVKFKRTTYIDDWLKQLSEASEDAEGYLVNLQEVATGFSNAVSDAFSTMVEGLVSGNGNIKDVFGLLLGFLADTLKQIGKALVAYGTAMEAFKKAFTNPWAAIAAGTALIAAGSVLSGLIDKMSSGGGGMSPSASYAAATVGGGSTLNLAGAPVYSGTAQEIRVTGTLKASGSQLVAVIENESKRKQLTT